MHTTHETRKIHIGKITPAKTLRNRAETKPKAAMAGRSGLVVLILLFIASLAYAVFGGAFAETAALDADRSVVAAAANSADVITAARSEIGSARFAASADRAH